MTAVAAGGTQSANFGRDRHADVTHLFDVAAVSSARGCTTLRRGLARTQATSSKRPSTRPRQRAVMGESSGISGSTRAALASRGLSVSPTLEDITPRIANPMSSRRQGLEVAAELGSDEGLKEGLGADAVVGPFRLPQQGEPKPAMVFQKGG